MFKKKYIDSSSVLFLIAVPLFSFMAKNGRSPIRWKNKKNRKNRRIYENNVWENKSINITRTRNKTEYSTETIILSVVVALVVFLGLGAFILRTSAKCKITSSDNAEYSYGGSTSRYVGRQGQRSRDYGTPTGSFSNCQYGNRNSKYRNR